MHICIHHLCVRVEMRLVFIYTGVSQNDRASTWRVWVFESLWCVCLTLLHLRALTHRDPTQKYLINLSLRVSNGLVLFWWTLTTWTMPYLGLNVTAFYLWKRWLYSFKVLLGIEAASNQLYKLTPANHQTYQGDVGPSSDYWEGFTKGLGYRHLWHLVKKNKKKKHFRLVIVLWSHISVVTM